MKLIIAIIFCLIVFNLSAKDQELKIAIASDLEPIMKEIKNNFEKSFSKKITIISGSSGKLYTQILNGLPVDLFFSADEQLAKNLFDKKMTAHAPQFFVTGKLVIYSAKHDINGISQSDLATKYEKITIANPKHAPYGKLAESILKEMGLYEMIKKKLVLGDNVSQSAQFLDSESVDLGFIPLSVIKGTKLSHKGKFKYFPKQYKQTLDQYFVILKKSKNQKIAEDFSQFLKDTKVTSLFESFGFIKK